MGWLSNSSSAKEDYWPEDCPYLLKKVSGGEVYRGCENLTVFSLGDAMIKPGQLNSLLGYLFSGICSTCAVPTIVASNPCEKLSLGVEVTDCIAGADGKQGSVKINAACSAKGTKISSPVSCNDGCLNFNASTDGELLYCRQCGQVIQDDASFCKNCGTEVKEKVES